jgi:hypothetical protein
MTLTTLMQASQQFVSVSMGFLGDRINVVRQLLIFQHGQGLSLSIMILVLTEYKKQFLSQLDKQV